MRSLADWKASTALIAAAWSADQEGGDDGVSVGVAGVVDGDEVARAVEGDPGSIGEHPESMATAKHAAMSGARGDMSRSPFLTPP